MKVVKNKVGKPFKEATFPLYYGIGVDRAYEIVELACLAEIIAQGGAWFSYRNEKGEIIERSSTLYRWQGKAQLTEFVKEHPEFLQELEDRLRGVEVDAPTGEAVDEDGYEVPTEPTEPQEIVG